MKSHMSPYNILILGASYGSLLATKLLMAGHSVKLVCLPAEADAINTDGARVRTEDGWWLARASNTQAVLVVRAESGSPEGLARLKDTVRRQLHRVGIAAPAGF